MRDKLLFVSAPVEAQPETPPTDGVSPGPHSPDGGDSHSAAQSETAPSSAQTGASIDKQAPANAGQSTSASEDLTALMRRLIHEELKNSEGPTPQPTPAHQHWNEAIGLALLIVNAVLIYIWLPEGLRKDKELLDFITRLVAFLGGGFAIANPAFFQKVLAAMGRRKSFMVTNLVVFVLLAAVRFGRLPLEPQSFPSDALISADLPANANKDARTSGVKPGTRLWLRLGFDHEIAITPKEPSDSTVEPRRVRLSLFRQLWYALPWSETPRWPLIRTVSLNFPEAGSYLVQINRQDGPFDDAFQASHPELAPFDPCRADRKQCEGTAHYTSDGTGADTVPLPFGRYTLTASVTDEHGKKCTTSASYDAVRQTAANFSALGCN